jgi:hypothetical protein
MDTDTFNRSTILKLRCSEILSRISAIHGNSVPFYSDEISTQELPTCFGCTNRTPWEVPWKPGWDLVLINDLSQLADLPELLPHSKVYAIAKAQPKDIYEQAARHRFYPSDVFIGQSETHVILFKERIIESQLWDGSHQPDKTLFLYSEWGWGDIIRNLRFLKPLSAMFKEVVFECRREMISLARIYPVTIRPKQAQVPQHDFHFRLEFLSRFLPVSFAPLPYTEKTALPSSYQHIGVAYRSSDIHSHAQRSFPPDFLRVRQAKLWSFTLNPPPFMQPILSDYESWEVTARAINAMGLIIAADSSVAHLAGALGIKTLCLLPSTPYRTSIAENTHLWYPNTTILTSQKSDWSDLAQITEPHIRKAVDVKLL